MTIRAALSRYYSSTHLLIFMSLQATVMYSQQPDKHEINIAAIIEANSFVNRQVTSNLDSQLIDVDRNARLRLLRSNYKIGLTPSVLNAGLSTLTPKDVMDFLCKETLERNVNVLLYFLDTEKSGRSAVITNFLVKFANYVGLPVVAWLRDDNSGLVQTSSDSIIVQLTPSVEHQCSAMISLLRYYNWSSFSIVTGKLAGREFFINNLRKKVDSAEDGRFTILNVVTIESLEKEHVERNLQKIYDAESRVILFYGKRSELEQIYEVAKKMQRKVSLFSKEFVWIVSKSVVGAGKFNFKQLPNGLLGLRFNVDVKESMKDAMEAVLKLWGASMEGLLKVNPNNRPSLLFRNQTCSSDGVMHWQTGDHIYQRLINQSRSDINFKFSPDGINKRITLEIVNLRKNHQWNVIGEWSPEAEIKIDDIYWPNDSPSPPSGRPAKYKLEVVTLDEDPYVKYSDPDPDTGNCPPMSYKCRIKPQNITNRYNDTSDKTMWQCASGLCLDLLTKLAESIGFEFDLFEVEDKHWGGYDPATGDWNGLVKAVRDGQADLVMTSLKSTPERNGQIDFSVPFLETGITIIVAVRDGVLTPTAFLKPFDVICWIIILVMCIQVLAVAVFLFEWLSPLGFSLQKTPVRREHRFSLFRSFWLIWAMLFGAAVNVDNPRGVSSRFLANIWALFAVVFTASYTANLATFMITKDDYDRLAGIDDHRLMYPEELKPAYKFATIPHGSTDTNIRSNYPQMYNYMQPLNRSTVALGVQAVKDGELNAFIYDASVLEFKASQDDKCMLKTVGKWSALTGYGIGFPKNSKWINTFNEELLKLQHDGTLERLQRFWLAGACKYKSDEETKSKSIPLGILNFTSAFILLAAGMLLGALLLLLEHIYFKFFRSKLRKYDKCGCCGLISLSMGKSLTFEQSVREAIELQKHHKCKNAVCETQTWKIKHELDLALLKIDRLSRQLGYSVDQVPTSSRCPGTDLVERETVL